MTFIELSNSRYFVVDGTYEKTGALSYKVNPDLANYNIELNGQQVRTISHAKGSKTIYIWRNDVGHKELPLNAEFPLDVNVTIRQVTI